MTSMQIQRYKQLQANKTIETQMQANGTKCKDIQVTNSTPIQANTLKFHANIIE